jgi:hypothetical protein
MGMRTACGVGGGLLWVLLAAACGGSSSPEPVLTGPFVIDFEDRPDDGFNTVPTPLLLGPGVTATATSAGANLWDFSTADAWGLVSCTAVATSGTMMMGVDGAPPVSVTIVFDVPVSRVRVAASEIDGATVSLEGFNQADASVGFHSVVSTCPALDASDVLEITEASNVIKRIVITGSSDLLTLDDLTYWRFE